MRRICNSDEIFDKRLKELKGQLVKRGFKKNMIENQFEKAKAKRRENLLYQDTNRNKQQNISSWQPGEGSDII